MAIFKISNWKRNGQIALWIALGALAATAGPRVYKALTLRKAPAASGIVPYTVIKRHDLYDPAGVLKATGYYVEAQRSDGSKVMRMTDDHLQQRFIYMADGGYIITDDLNGKKSTYTKTGRENFPPGRDPQAFCLSPEFRDRGFKVTGVDVIDGYRAAKVEGKLGKLDVAAWYALDAGCAEVKTSLGYKKLEAVIVGEPDPALFQVSAALKEMPPSEFYGRSNLGSKWAAIEDQKYRTARGE